MPPFSTVRRDQHARREAISEALIAWSRSRRATYPWRRKLPPWLALIAELMLQRTRATQVAPVFERFQSEYPDIQALRQAAEDDLRRIFQPLGLNWRVANLIALCAWIAVHDGRIPDSISDLLELPGVGPYTAAAYLSLHRGRREAIVDANVARVIARMNGKEFGPETRRAAWLLAEANHLTPHAAFKDYGEAILDLGIELCRPRRPHCEDCPIASWCDSASTYQPAKRAAASTGRDATRQGVSASATSR